MAQKLETQIRKLLEKHSVSDIITVTQSIKQEMDDIAVWNNMSDNDKTQWFMDQCAKYNLSTKLIDNRIVVEQFRPYGDKAHFSAWMSTDQDNNWHLEIGRSYADLWHPEPGLKGKEQQIAEIVSLYNKGE